MDRRFVQQFGGPQNEQILVLPLVLKDKVAALLYADGGAEGVLDAASLELLVMATSAWLEVTSLRKQAQKEIVDAAAAMPAAAPVQAVSSFSDPFAGARLRNYVAKAAPEPEPAAEVVEVSAHAAAASAASAPATAADPFAGISSEDADTHRKAQRFARLLVDEIKLYNQAKVAEGRRNKDLYDRLKEDIEKSRSTYQKRYGNNGGGERRLFSEGSRAQPGRRRLVRHGCELPQVGSRKSLARFWCSRLRAKNIRWFDWVSSGGGCSRSAGCAGVLSGANSVARALPWQAAGPASQTPETQAGAADKTAPAAKPAPHKPSATKPAASASKSNKPAGPGKTSAQAHATAAKKHRRPLSPRVRRIRQAFVASTTLRPMAQQLIQDRLRRRLCGSGGLCARARQRRCWSAGLAGAGIRARARSRLRQGDRSPESGQAARRGSRRLRRLLPGNVLSANRAPGGSAVDTGGF